ncbi:TPA: Ail/Lom family outer membrane beta-barrel protein [Serratia marcescens]|uniref:Ail/Lom family outer membrane beta-barrel protein n=1 Tax=Serratia marcescens TaxID=615 RepID=UPI000951D3D8|nr:Ail/Lom family outer membrane beta-barrel protein [Serratia marcescens]
MKKTSLLLLLGTLTFGVEAANKNTVSLGYAQSHGSLSQDARGGNVNYRYDITDVWGVITSYTHTNTAIDTGGVRNGRPYTLYANLRYDAFAAGPTYRFNPYVSIYGALGLARGKAKAEGAFAGASINRQRSESDNGTVYIAGLQINVTPEIAMNAHYEYSQLGGIDVNTWMLGAGYRF